MPVQPMHEFYYESQIITCGKCGNTESFVGHDESGFSGDDCKCGKDICECEVPLRQEFTISPAGEYDYTAFTGGGNGSEIGPYTRIECGKCGTVLYAMEEQHA